jgi:S-formylglutathione hydrolase FrmB
MTLTDRSILKPVAWTILVGMCFGVGMVYAESPPPAEPATKLTDKVKEVTQIAPRIEAVQFTSEVLGTDKTFCVVLPPDFAKGKSEKTELPFLLLLHGSSRNERTLIDCPETRKILLDAGFMIVLPDGDSEWYVDSPVRPKAKYATYLEEVLRLAETQYPLSCDPKRRAIAGWSMGGYGSLRFAQNHPDEFTAVASMIGVIDYPRPKKDFPPGQGYVLIKRCFGKDPKFWKEHNPIHFAEKLEGMSILLTTGDEAFDRTMNENFCKELDRLEIPYRFKKFKGGHGFDIMQKSLPLVMKHVQKAWEQEKK